MLRRTRANAQPSGEQDGGEVRIDVGARRVWLRGNEISLTRREFDLLARLMRSVGAVVTREDLMADVWDVNWFGSTKTLDVHMAALRRKLEEQPGSPAAHPHSAGSGLSLLP